LAVLQITTNRPLRRINLQSLHIFLTDAFTFIFLRPIEAWLLIKTTNINHYCAISTFNILVKLHRNG